MKNSIKLPVVFDQENDQIQDSKQDNSSKVPCSCAGSSNVLNVNTLAYEAYREVIIPRYADPLTLPKAKTICLRKVRGVCVEYAVKKKFLYRTGYLVIDLADRQDINGIVADCLRRSIIAGLLSGLIAAYLAGDPTGAAEAAFTSTLTQCLEDRLTSNSVVDVRIEFESGWGDWE